VLDSRVRRCRRQAWRKGFFSGVTRDQVYYVVVTPYSGPLVSGVPTGIAGLPVVDSTFVQFEVPSKPQFDTLQGDVTAIAGADVLVKTASAAFTAERVVTDTPTVSWDWSTAGQAKANAVGVAEIAAAVGNLSIPTVFFETGSGDDEQFATIPAASTEIDVGLRRRRNLTGAGSYRINANVSVAAASASAGVEYSGDGFSSSAALTTLPLTSTGRKTTGWITAPAGLMADLELRPVLSGGGGTDTCKLSLLEIEFLPARVSALRVHVAAFAAAFD
jgi:hypothetical protein